MAMQSGRWRKEGWRERGQKRGREGGKMVWSERRGGLGAGAGIKKTKQSGQIRFGVDGSEQSDYSNYTDSTKERAPGS